MRWRLWLLALLAIGGLRPVAASAYTAAGDREFAATLILPQIAPTDAFWGSFNTQHQTNGVETQLTGTYSKTITERLGIQFQDGITRLGSMTGGQNFDMQLQYEAVLNQQHEFVLSFQVDHEFGGTGDEQVGSFTQGATQPAFSFGKGLGDLPIGYWRAVAITGFAGYQVAQGTRRNAINSGFSVQYSIPYLLSKVANVELPSFLRNATPITEVLFSTPTGHGRGPSTSLTVAPGISYTTGRGWELAIEALIPTTRAAGTGVGVIGQLVIELDYLLPDSFFGHPIFLPR